MVRHSDVPERERGNLHVTVPGTDGEYCCSATKEMINPVSSSYVSSLWFQAPVVRRQQPLVLITLSLRNRVVRQDCKHRHNKHMAHYSL